LEILAAVPSGGYCKGPRENSMAWTYYCIVPHHGEIVLCSLSHGVALQG
jgi:hypothetical protein